MKTTKIKPAETPLSVTIQDHQIVIRIGIDTLEFAARAENGGSLGEGAKVANRKAFAREIVHELINEEEEDGSNLVHRMFDKAIDRLAENGAECLEFAENGKEDSK